MSSFNPEDLLGQQVSFLGKISRIIYSQNHPITPGTFCIFSIEVQEVLEGELVYSSKAGDIITCKGEVPSLKFGVPYKIIGELVESKYGFQYNILTMNTSFNLSSEEDQRNFFEYILPSAQVKLLFDNFDNPVELLKNKDISKLTSVKGIGLSKAYAMIQKYEDNQDKGMAYAQLKEYGLTKNAIDKLIKVYKYPEVAVEKVKENPYILIEEVNGFGWRKCDEIAAKAGIGENNESRIKAFVKYYLTDQAESNGHTWVTKDNLIEAIFSEAPNIDGEYLSNILKRMIASGILWKDDERVALMRYRKLEEKIAEELLRINNGPMEDLGDVEKVITEAEFEVGYSYTDEQKQAIRTILSNKICILNGIAGCVDKDTEFFNGEGWKKISEYQKGEKVLQYSADGKAILVEPIAYIKNPCDLLYHIESKYGVDMTVSLDHRMPYLSDRGNLNIKTIEEIKSRQENNVNGFDGHFLTTFQYSGEGVNLSDAEIKVMLAVICDGSFTRNSSWCRFHIKKERKKIELKKIFAEAGIPLEERTSAAEGYNDYFAYVPRREKEFSDFWYGCNHHQLEVICENILQWDGNQDSRGRKRFSTSIKKSADFVQFAFSSCGYRARIITNDRRGQQYFTCGKLYVRKSIEYNVQITDRTTVCIGNFKKENLNSRPKFIPVVPEDGYQYCFTVPSSMWVMRRNGKILISSNCGKTSVMLPVVKAAMTHNLDIEQCCLAGKAALNLSNITKIEGKTIHRLLGFNAATGEFTFDQSNKLPVGLLVVDEISMIGGELFYDLLKAIPDDCRVVLIGDPGQLESIGLANVAKDARDSGVIPVANLTKVHRQSAKSGILFDSVKIYNSEQFISSAFVGESIHGEIRDFKIISAEDGRRCAIQAIEEYKKLLLEKKISVNDITVITCKRSIGETSARAVNEYIQKIANPCQKGQDNLTYSYKDGSVSYDINYRVGDRVLVTKNSYNTPLSNGMGEVDIFNGNLGTIKWITEEQKIMGVEFPVGEVVLKQDKINDLQLGYAITCHKAQGSTIPYVIALCTNESYVLNSKEMLYTQITRAKKYCCLIGQTSAIRASVMTSKVKKKQTFLSELLRKEFFAESKKEGEIYEP